MYSDILRILDVHPPLTPEPCNVFPAPTLLGPFSHSFLFSRPTTKPGGPSRRPQPPELSPRTVPLQPHPHSPSICQYIYIFFMPRIPLSAAASRPPSFRNGSHPPLPLRAPPTAAEPPPPLDHHQPPQWQSSISRSRLALELRPTPRTAPFFQPGRTGTGYAAPGRGERYIPCPGAGPIRTGGPGVPGPSGPAPGPAPLPPPLGATAWKPARAAIFPPSAVQKQAEGGCGVWMI